MFTELVTTIFSTIVLAKIGLVIIVFSVLIRFIKKSLHKIFEHHFSRQTELVVLKLVSFIGYIFAIFIIIDILGLNNLFTTLLGTAGVVGVAVGFASKTSLENLISGILFISDKSFTIDDVIVVDDKEGVVDSIDILSIKIRTYDNKIIRIPNKKLLETDVINLYPSTIRRYDLVFKVSYNSDLYQVETLLKDIAQHNPHVLQNKEPYIAFLSFEDVGYQIKFGLWFTSGNIDNVRNSIIKDISQVFKANNIEIPRPLLHSP